MQHSGGQLSCLARLLRIRIVRGIPHASRPRERTRSMSVSHAPSGLGHELAILYRPHIRRVLAGTYPAHLLNMSFFTSSASATGMDSRPSASACSSGAEVQALRVLGERAHGLLALSLSVNMTALHGRFVFTSPVFSYMNRDLTQTLHLHLHPQQTRTRAPWAAHAHRGPEG